jgi:acyl dehydratase
LAFALWRAAAKTEFGKPLVNSCFTFSLLVGVSVHVTTFGTLVANLAYDKVVFPRPVFAGDTLHCESECVALRESKSRPNAGIVTWAQRAFNQRDELVCECTRTALIQKRPA